MYLTLISVCIAQLNSVSLNEAVVEGMGSIVNLHADGRRGLNAQAYVQEAFIHVNGPMIDKADGLVTEALDIHFGDKPWHFTQRSAVGLSSAFSASRVK